MIILILGFIYKTLTDENNYNILIVATCLELLIECTLWGIKCK
jgi:hypothetical protein